MINKSILIATTFFVAALAGCTAPTDDEGDARVAFYVKDAPADEFDGVFVSFNKVEVHRTGGGDGVEAGEEATSSPTAANTAAATNTTASTNATATNTTTSSAHVEAGWITIFTGNETIDLKAFQGDAKAFLGEANISAGKYTQIRIHVSQAYGTMGDNRTNFTLPSGKLKLTGTWEAKEGEATQLIVDFLLDKSIHKTGQDRYMFKPTLKLVVEKKAKLDSSDIEDPSLAATRAKGAKPTDKGKPGAGTTSSA